MKRFKNILCVIEDEESCKPALERAVTLAENNHAKLTVVDVIPRVTAGIGLPEGGPISADLQATRLENHTQQLKLLIEPYRARTDIKIRVLIGVPFLEIIREILRNEHDLVIKTPENQDWLDRLFGSDDMHLLRKCPCPVLLIKPQAATSFKRILAAVDVDEAYPETELASRQALNRLTLELASSLALSDFAVLHIAHAWEALGEGALQNVFSHTPKDQIIAYVEQVRQQRADSLDALLQEVTRNLGQDTLDYLKPRTHLIKGEPRQEIPALANQIKADLIVMGTVARTGVPGFIMGNTAETILNQIDCSVLAVKPADFITPVTLED